MIRFRTQPQHNKHNFKALLSFIKFIALVGGLVVFLYKYRQEIKGQVKKLSSKYDQVDNFVKTLKDAVEDFEEKAEDFHKKTSEASKVAEKKLKEVKKQIKELDEDSPFKLNERQEAIYNVIKSAGEATMSDISEVIAGVTSRTLRRDTTKLEKLGLIEQFGRTKSSAYRIRK